MILPCLYLFSVNCKWSMFYITEIGQLFSFSTIKNPYFIKNISMIYFNFWFILAKIIFRKAKDMHKFTKINNLKIC
jgi:hypothetical protein